MHLIAISPSLALVVVDALQRTSIDGSVALGQDLFRQSWMVSSTDAEREQLMAGAREEFALVVSVSGQVVLCCGMCHDVVVGWLVRHIRLVSHPPIGVGGGDKKA